MGRRRNSGDCPAGLFFAFGGASQGHALRLALVELAALPLLALAAGRLIQQGLWREHRFSLGLLAAVAAIPLAQIVPMPPGVWTSLPGREQMVLALDLAGLQPGWSALSVTPDRTWGSALALLPPAAIFLAILSMGLGQRERLVQLCIAGSVAGILLGAAQLASGGDALYLWDWVTGGQVRGFSPIATTWRRLCWSHCPSRSFSAAQLSGEGIKAPRPSGLEPCLQAWSSSPSQRYVRERGLFWWRQSC